MGGKSSSETKSSTSTSNTTTVTDRRTVADGQAIVVGDNSSGIQIQQVDHGAIEGAFNVAGVAADIANKAVLGATALATQASEQQGKTALAAFDLAGKSAELVGKSAETIKGAFTVAADSAQGNRTLALAGLTLAAVVGLAAFYGKK